VIEINSYFCGFSLVANQDSLNILALFCGGNEFFFLVPIAASRKGISNTQLGKEQTTFIRKILIFICPHTTKTNKLYTKNIQSKLLRFLYSTTAAKACSNEAASCSISTGDKEGSTFMTCCKESISLLGDSSLTLSGGALLFPPLV